MSLQNELDDSSNHFFNWGYVEPGHVYFVSTPIGNLLDITQRAIAVLTAIDIISAEDTRHTGTTS